MKLHVHELASELSQAVRTGAYVQNVVAIRPHIYRHGTSFSPTDKLWLEIHSSNGLMATSEELLISDLPSGNYFHGLVRLYIQVQLQKNTQYQIKLKSNFTFSESAFIGWCSDFDFHTNQSDYDYSQSLLQAPLRYEVWTKS